jgi:hypothetical protein
VLTIEASPLAELWDDLLSVHQLGNGKAPDGARRLQLVPDRVAHLATPHHAHLLDKTFRGLLDADERRLSDALLTVDQIIRESSDHPTAHAVAQALESFGGPEQFMTPNLYDSRMVHDVKTTVERGATREIDGKGKTVRELLAGPGRRQPTRRPAGQ